MDLMTLSTKSKELDYRCSSINNPEQEGERATDIVKQVKAKSAIKNRWGGKTHPIDIRNYLSFIGALQSLGWIFRDMGFDVKFLTRNGLLYDQSKMTQHGKLYSVETGKIAALILTTSGKEGNYHYRITRDKIGLRIRRFETYGQAVAPVTDFNASGTKAFSVQTVKELVKIMNRQSTLMPDEESLIKWGRSVQHGRIKPYGTAPFKNMMKNEFRKVGGKVGKK